MLHLHFVDTIGAKQKEAGLKPSFGMICFVTFLLTIHTLQENMVYIWNCGVIAVMCEKPGQTKSV